MTVCLSSGRSRWSMSVRRGHDALVHEELRGGRARHARRLLGGTEAGRTRPMVPHRQRPATTPESRGCPGARVSSAHAPRPRHRQHEHHDRPVPGRRAARDAPGGHRRAGDARRARARCSTACSASTTSRLADLDAIALASVVPALTGAVEAIAERRDRPLLIASAGHDPARGPGRSAGRRRRRPAGQRPGRGPAVRHAGRRRRLRDRDDVRLRRRGRGVRRRARSRRGSSSVSRRSRRGPPSCHGSSCARRTGRSGGTRSAPSSRARSSATRRSASGLLERVRARARRGERRRAGRGPGDPDRRAVARRPGSAASDGIDAIDPDLTLKGLAILHAEVGGGEPLELGLA